jgi:hypothetical protein
VTGRGNVKEMVPTLKESKRKADMSLRSHIRENSTREYILILHISY